MAGGLQCKRLGRAGVLLTMRCSLNYFTIVVSSSIVSSFLNVSSDVCGFKPVFNTVCKCLIYSLL